MHELPITQNILKIALRYGQENQASKITDLYLVIGQLSSVIDDSMLHEKLTRANRRFGVVVDDKANTIRRYLDLTVAEDPEASSLVASALYSVHAEQVRGLEGKVRILAEEASDAFVRETAIWVGGRLGLEGLEPDEEE